MEPFLEGMQLPEVAKLVYRDDIRLKHDGRQRLAKEIDDKLQSLGVRSSAPQVKQPLLPARPDSGADPMSKMLVKYMMEAASLW